MGEKRREKAKKASRTITGNLSQVGQLFPAPVTRLWTGSRPYAQVHCCAVLSDATLGERVQIENRQSARTVKEKCRECRHGSSLIMFIDELCVPTSKFLTLKNFSTVNMTRECPRRQREEKINGTSPSFGSSSCLLDGVAIVKESQRFIFTKKGEIHINSLS
ncbi:hypothetical protein TNCV_1892791 [Trichonephila clavipes]|nr:hypothetical protein TNCV_1892791 [Trichonephila clavipes]